MTNKMVRNRRGLVLAFVVILTVVITAGAHAQWAQAPPPIDSAYWWTLSDDVSPTNLRAALQSREESQKRLKDAVSKGAHPAVSEADLREVSLFLEGSLTPDLVPMFTAFGVFARGSAAGPENWESASRTSLAERRMSPEAIESVILAAFNYVDRKNAIIARIGNDQRRFADEVLRPSQEILGRHEAADAIGQQDIAKMSQASGLDNNRVSSLYQTWLRDPLAEAGVEALTNLRASLDTKDWEAFRFFLLKEIAPTISFDYSGERPLR